jgi:hypothetical protein
MIKRDSLLATAGVVLVATLAGANSALAGSGARPAPPDPRAVAIGPSQAAACRNVEVLIYAARGRDRLLRALTRYSNPCAQYYVTVPTCEDGTHLRGVEGCEPEAPVPADQIRQYGPNFRALAEFRYNDWKKSPGTWAQKGAEFRRQLAVGRYDSWAIQEVPEGARKSASERLAVRQAIAGVYAGADPPLAGAALNWNMGEATRDLSTYKGQWQSWALASGFWSTMSKAVRWWGQETYADCLAICVAGSTLAAREQSLNAYLQHPARLAFGRIQGTAAVREFFDAAYMPLVNAFWRSEGFGRTHKISLTTMKRLIRLQVYATRKWVDRGLPYPDSRIGFAWNEQTTRMTPAQADELAKTLAVALRAAYGPGGTAAQVCYTASACAPVRKRAAFYDSWDSFGTW